MDTLITCYFTNCFDFQKGKAWEANKEDLRPLIDSLNGVNLVVLNDCFPDKKEGTVTYKRVETSISPYFQRWVSIYQFLQANKDIDRAFCIDATDVELLKNSFHSDLGDYLYVGDEPGKLNSEWMRKYHRSRVIQKFIAQYGEFRIMNAGICGGNRELLMQFIHKLLSVHFDNQSDVFYKRNGAVTMDSDMGIFNYVCYRFFAVRVKHGPMVNTEFKAYEYNDHSFFKHK